MRRLTILLIALALATPAGAQQGPRRLRIVEPPKTVPLRPAETPPEPPPEVPAAPPPGFTPVRSADRDADRCRLACAKTLYFCLAEEDEVMCNGQWAQCAAGCS